MAIKTGKLTTQAGICDFYLAIPDGIGPFPAVLYYSDVGGLRDDVAMAITRLSAAGYVVFAPNLFYRLGHAPVMQLAELADPHNMPRIFAMVDTLSPDVVLADAEAFLQYLDRRADVRPGPAGIVGYCMSGGMALRIAGAFPERIAAAASFHGSNLATDMADSPHCSLAAAKAEIHVGLASEDFVMPEDQVLRLRTALDAAGIACRIEVHPGTTHGYTTPNTPGFDPVEAERHWEHLLTLFERNLAPFPSTSTA